MKFQAVYLVVWILLVGSAIFSLKHTKILYVC